MTRWLLLLAFLPLANAQSGNGLRFDIDVQTAAKNVPPGAQAPVYTIPGSKVTVCAGVANPSMVTSTCTPSLTVYSDPALTIPVMQPLTADQNGRVGGWLGPSGNTLPAMFCATSQPGTFLGCQFLVSHGGAGNGTEFQANGTDLQSFTPVNFIGGDGIGITNPSAGIVRIAQVPKFAINSFSCNTAGNYEIGQTVASPTNCAASYSQPANSATLTDGTHTVALTTPYTTGSLPYSYTLGAQGTVNVGLTAVGGTTQTAGVTLNWFPRTFYGVGTSGATGATASGSTAILSGATGTLQTWGLGQTVGTFSVTAASQYIYVLDTAAGRSFKVNGFSTAFTSQTLAFTNQYGITVPMTLYTSPTFLVGTYAVEVD